MERLTDAEGKTLVFRCVKGNGLWKGFCAVVIKLHSPVADQCCGCRPMIRPVVFFQPFSSFLFSSRPCKARDPLCHMSESRHKDCKPRKAQWIRVNEGKISFFFREISDLHTKNRNNSLQNVNCHHLLTQNLIWLTFFYETQKEKFSRMLTLLIPYNETEWWPKALKLQRITKSTIKV